MAGDSLTGLFVVDDKTKGKKREEGERGKREEERKKENRRERSKVSTNPARNKSRKKRGNERERRWPVVVLLVVLVVDSLSLFRGQPRLRVREQHYRVSHGNKRVGYGRIETIQKEKEKRISMEGVLLCTP